MIKKNKKDVPTEDLVKASSNAGRKSSNFIKPRLSKDTKVSGEGDLEQDVPRITNETVEQTRKEVIKEGRKYRYPIISTPKRILGLSVAIGTSIFIVFSSLVLVRLYSQNDYSDFVYNVTKVVPLPIAKVGGSFVSYEDYLFELRRYVTYFETQQNVDFDTDEAQNSLDEQRRRALQQVINQEYVKKLARQNSITVTPEEVNAEIELLREQNKLGDGRAFEDVIQSFWGWDLDDYRRSVSNELLRQKVTEALDDTAKVQADAIYQRLEAGEDFATLAAEFSADLVSAQNGGEYGFLLDQEDQNEDPKVLRAAFDTDIDQISTLVNTGYKYEIIKVLGEENGQRRAAHISLPFKDIGQAINDLKEDQPASVYANIDLDQDPEADPAQFEPPISQ